MDYTLPLIPSKVALYRGRKKPRDYQDEEKEKDTEDSVGVRSDERADLFDVRTSPGGDGLHVSSELDGGSNMSSEDALMEKLFQACDPYGKGRVKVSDVVEYLTTIVDMQLQEGRAVASLLAILDPKNTNSEINSEVFHSGIHRWIEQMKSGDLMDMNVLSSRESSATFDASQSEGLELSLDESSVEDKLSVSQLSSRVTDLQYLNRKVSEEIKESRAIIDSKEEELSKLSRDLEKAKTEIKRLLELADLRHEAEAENEELREQMSTLNKKLEAERHRTHQTEQEKELLKAQLQRYKSQVDKLISDLDLSQHQQGDMKSLLAKNKEKISHLKMTCCNFDAQLAEKDEHIQQLQTCLRELTRINEDLRNQTQELRGQLSDTHQELFSIRSVLNETNSGVKLPSLREMASEIEEDVEHPGVVTAERLSSSIHNELQNLFNDSPNLPWPLSEKELKECVVTTPDLVSQVGHAVNTNSQGIDEEAGNSEMSDPQKGNSADDEASTQMKMKCSCDYHYDVSTEKLRLFVSLLKHFKDENQKLRHIVEHTSLGRKDCSEALDVSCKEPTASGLKEPPPCSKLEVINDELSGPRQDQAELETLVKRLQSDNKKLVLEIDQLQRSNVKLSEGLQKSELRICELDEEFQNSQSSLNNEKQRCSELEESLFNSTLARQLDLHDIWRLVQKDVETECEDFQDDCSNESTTDQLKDKIKADIENLKARLEKREAALGSLKNNNLNLQLTFNNDELHQTTRCCNGRRWAPSSPLVDALTIDVLNGNLPMYNTNFSNPPPFVSCEDVDCYDCRAARLFIQNRFASSCPSIVPTNVNSRAQTQSQESNPESEQHIYTERHLDERARSFEVDPGGNSCATNALKRKRSLYGSYRRQDFIKSSGRGMKENVQYRSLQNQQLETRTVTQKDNQVHVDSNIETSLHNQTLFNKNAANFVSYTNIVNRSIHDLTDDYNLHVRDDHELNRGVRRSSFKLAVEINPLQTRPISTSPQIVLSNKDNYSSIEELRRPSFHAAIERGKDHSSAPISLTKRKVVKIASPEISERAVQDHRQKFDNNDNVYNSEISEGFTFYFEELDSDSIGETDSGAEVWDITDSRNCGEASMRSNSSTSAPSSSTKVSSSMYSTTSSYTISDDLSSRSSMGARYPHQKEEIDTNKRGKESLQEHADVSNNSAFRYAPRGDTSAGMNQHSLNLKENGHQFKDEVGHPNSDRRIKTSESKSSSARHTNNSPSSSARHTNSSPSSSARPTNNSLCSSARHTSSSPSSSRRGLAIVPSLLNSSTPPTSSSLQAGPSMPAPPSGKAPERSQDTAEGLSQQHAKTVYSQAGIQRGAAEARKSDEGSVSEAKSSSRKSVAPASSGSKCSTPVGGGTPQPVAQSNLSKIRENHLASKKREQMKARSMKLPELAEHSELEARPIPSAPTITTEEPSTYLSVNSSMDMPQISVTDEDSDLPPAPTKNIVTPSLPDSFLTKLGLSVTDASGDKAAAVSVDQLTDKEIESKFISLSLAFRTDKLTLSQRVSVQERSRDLAEQNVDVELEGLRSSLGAFNELVTDAELRALLQKIKLHINVLEQLAARVSTRAEMFGAVQQEKRLCRAMEVMVMYTENLRRIREKEESELHEARKVLSEKSGNIIITDPDGSRRSSAGGYSTVTRMMRRRSEIVLPKIIGGVGGPTMTPTAIMESPPPFLGQTINSATPQEPQDGEDPKSRFQSAVASTSMQNVITSTMRRSSLEKGPAASPLSSTPSLISSSPSTFSINTESSISRGDKGERQFTKDEEAFRKGFEEGLKSKLSHELDELRDQQNTISESLEQIMDKVEQSQLEDDEYFSRPSRLEASLSLASTVGGHMLHTDWKSNKKMFRYLAGVFFTFLAIFFMFLCPPISTVDVKHVTTPPQ